MEVVGDHELHLDRRDLSLFGDAVEDLAEGHEHVTKQGVVVDTFAGVKAKVVAVVHRIPC
ncbi:hypothetical protein GCM10009839_33430 [Catenulispora yoronensis]|uniref:Uncharacterized protein n=1 Tax=Catenulispora yoronensis TaxID=450799 RepID=A0ABN2U8P4_9ACTN